MGNYLDVILATLALGILIGVGVMWLLSRDERTMPDGDASRDPWRCPVCGHRDSMVMGGCAKCGN